ncbi:phosphatase PAP2 family protein [Streptomyces nojiriensis]|uniref:phosphatase PAP2 family protein n=1 Tax=Streptomyces nojiriensis TaxID=66374 RepID=UPI002E17EC51
MDSSGLYRAVTDFAHRTPPSVQSAFEVWTAYGLLLFGVLFAAVRWAAVWWRSRGRDAARPVALAMAVRRLAPLTVPLALLMAFSRVFVGVHHPHDVAFGLLLGGSVAALTVLALTGPARAAVIAARAGDVPAVVWFTGRGPARRGRGNVPGCRLP